MVGGAGNEAAIVVATVLGYVILFQIAFLPALCALARRHRRLPFVATVNLLLGWTGIGWLVAMAVAQSPDDEPHPEPVPRWTA